MVNLNECKFGDKLKMRNGEMAVYVGKAPHCVVHFLVASDEELGYAMLYAEGNGVMLYHNTREFDIIGKWEDEV